MLRLLRRAQQPLARLSQQKPCVETQPQAKGGRNVCGWSQALAMLCSLQAADARKWVPGTFAIADRAMLRWTTAETWLRDAVAGETSRLVRKTLPRLPSHSTSRLKCASHPCSAPSAGRSANSSLRG